MFDRPPEEKWHRAEALIFRVGAPVLVESDVFKSQCQDGRDGRFILVCQTDFQCVTQTIDQIAKPVIRLGRKIVAGPGKYEQAVEIVERCLRSSGFLNKTGPFSMPNSPLDRVFVESPGEFGSKSGRRSITCN